MDKIDFRKLNQVDDNSADYLWYILTTMWRAVRSIIIRSKYEYVILNYLVETTINKEDSPKLRGNLPLEDLRERSLCLTSDPLNRIKSRLIKRNVIISLSNNSYCLNLPGVVALYIEIFSPYYESKKLWDKVYDLSRRIMFREKIIEIFPLDYAEKRKIKLEETLKEHAEQRRERLKKGLKKEEYL